MCVCGGGGGACVCVCVCGGGGSRSVSNFGPNVKKPTTSAKKGGGPLDPPPGSAHVNA